jgi:hypothetical protein
MGRGGVKLLPHIAIFKYTTGAAHDRDGDGPEEYEGKQIAITWLRWTLEIAITRLNRVLGTRE